VDRHLPALDVVLDIADAVADHADHVTASDELSSRLPVGREDPVLRLQRHRLGYRHAFLA